MYYFRNGINNLFNYCSLGFRGVEQMIYNRKLIQGYHQGLRPLLFRTLRICSICPFSETETALLCPRPLALLRHLSGRLGQRRMEARRSERWLQPSTTMVEPPLPINRVSPMSEPGTGRTGAKLPSSISTEAEHSLTTAIFAMVERGTITPMRAITLLYSYRVLEGGGLTCFVDQPGEP